MVSTGTYESSATQIP